jgi:hypothetical protein
MPDEPSSVSFYWLAFYASLALVFSGAAIYFWNKSKITESKLEFEMQDVRNIANVGSVDQAMARREENRAGRS